MIGYRAGPLVVLQCHGCEHLKEVVDGYAVSTSCGGVRGVMEVNPNRSPEWCPFRGAALQRAFDDEGTLGSVPLEKALLERVLAAVHGGNCATAERLLLDAVGRASKSFEMLVIVHSERCDCAGCVRVLAKRLQMEDMLQAQAKSRKRWVPHISCNGARFHVLTWYGVRDVFGKIHGECRCSEPRCEINRPSGARR